VLKAQYEALRAELQADRGRAESERAVLTVGLPSFSSPHHSSPLLKTIDGITIGRFRYIACVKCQTELRTQRLRSAQGSWRQVECPYGVADKASALGAGSHIPKSAYSCR